MSTHDSPAPFSYVKSADGRYRLTHADGTLVTQEELDDLIREANKGALDGEQG